MPVTWLTEFSEDAAQSDQITKYPSHIQLLAAGLLGECGSVLAELKKEKRERDAYPAHRETLVQELGDFLWYYARLVETIAPGLLPDLPTAASDKVKSDDPFRVFHCLRF